MNGVGVELPDAPVERVHRRDDIATLLQCCDPGTGLRGAKIAQLPSAQGRGDNSEMHLRLADGGCAVSGVARQPGGPPVGDGELGAFWINIGARRHACCDAIEPVLRAVLRISGVVLEYE